MIAKLEVFMTSGVRVDIGFHTEEDVNRIMEAFKRQMPAKQPFNITQEVQGAAPGSPNGVTYYFIPENIVYYGLITFARSPSVFTTVP